MAKQQKADGESLVMMIMEGVEDADDDTLASMAQAMLGCIVENIGDDEFVVHWDQKVGAVG